MSKNYDNWGKLVGAVLKREQLKQLALSHSSSTISFRSSSSSSSSEFFDHHHLLVHTRQSIQPDVYSFDSSDFETIVPQYQPDSAVTISRSPPGKLVFVPVEARELTICTEDFPERQLPYSTTYYDCRSSEAVEVNSVLSLDIRGKIKTRLLSANTVYGAYLVFKANDKLIGFESAKSMVRFGRAGIDFEPMPVEEFRFGSGTVTAVEKKMVPFFTFNFPPSFSTAIDVGSKSELKGEAAVRRADGWSEVGLGRFYVEDEDEDEEMVEVRFMETSSRVKTGLLVEGIEFRPLLKV